MSGIPLGTREEVDSFISGVENTRAIQEEAWGTNADIYRGSTLLTLEEFATRLAVLAGIDDPTTNRVASVLSSTAMLSFAKPKPEVMK
jgi:hypothetical protein